MGLQRCRQQYSDGSVVFLEQFPDAVCGDHAVTGIGPNQDSAGWPVQHRPPAKWGHVHGTHQRNLIGGDQPSKVEFRFLLPGDAASVRAENPVLENACVRNTGLICSDSRLFLNVALPGMTAAGTSGRIPYLACPSTCAGSTDGHETEP